MSDQAIRPSRSIATVAVAAALVAVAAATAPALAQPLRAGIEVPFEAESPHPYLSGAGDAPVWSVAIEHPGATYIAVHFDRFELGPGDRVVVRSESGKQSYAFTGRGKAGLGAFWATHVKGDRAVVELFSPSPHPGAWGVSIDKFAAGSVDLGGESTETVCFGEDRENAICYAASEPQIYANARPVARLLLQGAFLCTGWLVGCEGHLMTNNHCVDNPAYGNPPAVVAVNTDYEFLSETPTCGSPNCQIPCYPGNLWSGTPTLIQNSVSLDVALIHLAGNPQDTYGALFLDDRLPAANERIYFPQHPGGRAKEIGVFSDAPLDESGFCEVASPAGGDCNIPGEPPNVTYYCDSEGGSSGSPILSYVTHNVVALHHCSGCANLGLPIPNIITALGSNLPACAIAGDPELLFDHVTVDDTVGNKNGFADPFEIPLLEVFLRNGGSGRADNASGVLSTTTPGITIHDDTATWPAIQALLTVETEAPHFQVEIDAGVPCGTVINFDLAVTSDAGPFDFAFQVPVGNMGSCAPVPCFTTAQAAAVPDPICDGDETVLDASASTEFGQDCSGSLEYRFEIGVSVLQDWSSDPTLAVVPPQSTVYTVKVRDQVTLAQSSAFPPVTVHPVPAAAIVQTVDPVCIEYDAVELDAGAGFSSYVWRDDLNQIVGTSRLLALDGSSCGRTYTVEVGNGTPCTDTAAHVSSCITCRPPEVSPAGSPVPFRVGIDTFGTLEFELLPEADVRYHLYNAVSLAAMQAGDWTWKYCDLENLTLGTWTQVDATTVHWRPVVPGVIMPGYWVVIAERLDVESFYGFQSGGAPRTPDADGAGSSGSLGCP